MSLTIKTLYEFGSFRLNPAERLLLVNGEPVPLAPKAFDLLVVLVRNSGCLLSKGELIKTVWADAVVEDNNLDKTISALRKALGEDSAERKLIETVRGHGYRFIGSVIEIVADQSEVATRKVSADSREPGDQSLLLFQEDVQTTAQQSPSSPVRQRVTETARSWLGKSALFAGAVLLLAVLISIRVWSSKDALPYSSLGMKVVRLTNGGYITHAVISPDGKYFAYAEQDMEVSRLWLRQVAGGQALLLVSEIKLQLLGLTFARDSQAIYYVELGDVKPRGVLNRVGVLGGPVSEILTGIVSPIAFSPDGQRFAFVRQDGEGDKQTSNLAVADANGTNQRTVLTRPGAQQLGWSGPAWSPDGNEIACQLLSGLSNNGEHVWRVIGVNSDSGAQRMLTAQQWDACGRIAWTLDGRGLVLVGTRQGEGVTTSRDSVWFVSQPDGAVRRMTTDLSRHVYVSVSVTDDGRSLLVIPFNRTSQIWSVEGRVQDQRTRFDLQPPVQLTTGTGDGRAGLASLNDGRIVYVARTGEHVDLWRMNYDGSNQQQLTTDPPFLEELSTPLDGSFFVFASNRARYSHLFRVNREGTALRQLTSGESQEIDSDCSLDGRWIVYTSRSGASDKIPDSRLWKIPAEGGTPIRLTDHAVQTPRFSPDGRWISCIYPNEKHLPQIAVIPSDGGAPFKVFEVPYAAELNVGCRWTPDGKALTYIVKGKSFDNLWAQPLTRGAPHALTALSSGEIYNYAFARDGRRLFLARGHSIRDVALMTDFR